MVEISVIIPTMKGREEKLKKLLSTIPKWVVDIIIVDDEGLLLAAKRNKGARLAAGKYLFFIDDDNYLDENCVNQMLSNFTDATGAMGVTACYHNRKRIIADGGSRRWLESGFAEGLRTNESIFDWGDKKYPVDEVANAFMIRRDVFDEVGGFDENNFPIDMDEADICLRIRKLGYQIVMNPKAICYHDSITYSWVPDFRRPMNAYMMGRNRILFQRKHLPWIEYLGYLVFSFPLFVLFYVLSLACRRKPKMIYYFLKGVCDGLLGRKENPYQ